MVPDCGYNMNGIEAIRLLDFDDFGGFKFDGDGLYDSCYVSEILQHGDSSYVDIATPDSAKYTSTLNNGTYAHTIETFIGDLSASLASSLHLAIKKRYIVLFRTKARRYFVFGYEAGATVTYVNQTADGLGSLVTISANSIYPLFERAPYKIGQYLTVSPAHIILEKPNTIKSFILTSSSPWMLVSGSTQRIAFDTTKGGEGAFIITAKGLATGQGLFTFQNRTGQTATIRIAYIKGRPWVLENGTWNMIGFWYNDGIWKYR